MTSVVAGKKVHLSPLEVSRFDMERGGAGRAGRRTGFWRELDRAFKRMPFLPVLLLLAVGFGAGFTVVILLRQRNANSTLSDTPKSPRPRDSALTMEQMVSEEMHRWEVAQKFSTDLWQKLPDLQQMSCNRAILMGQNLAVAGFATPLLWTVAGIAAGLLQGVPLFLKPFHRSYHVSCL